MRVSKPVPVVYLSVDPISVNDAIYSVEPANRVSWIVSDSQASPAKATYANPSVADRDADSDLSESDLSETEARVAIVDPVKAKAGAKGSILAMNSSFPTHLTKHTYRFMSQPTKEA